MSNELFYIEIIDESIREVLKKTTSLIYKKILDIDYDFSTLSNGSSDTSYHWATLSAIFLLCFFFTIIWSLVDKKTRKHSNIYYWITVLVRYYIAFTLIRYGILKVFHSQMAPINLNHLTTPLGELSPMGLAWVYFGYSKGFNILIGCIEISAGLLLFRKTMLIGLLIIIPVCANIVIVNYFFDIPVKIISTALLVLSIFLLIPSFPSLFNLLIKNKFVKLNFIERPRYKITWKNNIISYFKGIIIISFIIIQTINISNRKKQIESYYKVSPFYGIYRIANNNIDNNIIPKEWTIVVFQYNNQTIIRDNNFEKIIISSEIDTLNKYLYINNHKFNYTIQTNGDIVMENKRNNQSYFIKFLKQDINDYNLKNQKFKWIQERPFL